MLSDNKSILNKARIEIGALKADFDAESQPVKTLMSKYTDLFTSFLPKIEDAISYLEEMHEKIHNWKGNISRKDIMRYKAEYYEDKKGFEISLDSAIACTAIFKEKLVQAKQYAAGSTR